LANVKVFSIGATTRIFLTKGAILKKISTCWSNLFDWLINRCWCDFVACVEVNVNYEIYLFFQYICYVFSKSVTFQIFGLKKNSFNNCEIFTNSKPMIFIRFLACFNYTTSIKIWKRQDISWDCKQDSHSM
jgi:hypothetical protein